MKMNEPREASFRKPDSDQQQPTASFPRRRCQTPPEPERSGSTRARKRGDAPAPCMPAGYRTRAIFTTCATPSAQSIGAEEGHRIEQRQEDTEPGVAGDRPVRTNAPRESLSKLRLSSQNVFP